MKRIVCVWQRILFTTRGPATSGVAFPFPAGKACLWQRPSPLFSPAWRGAALCGARRWSTTGNGNTHRPWKRRVFMKCPKCGREMEPGAFSRLTPSRPTTAPGVRSSPWTGQIPGTGKRVKALLLKGGSLAHFARCPIFPTPDFVRFAKIEGILNFSPCIFPAGLL